MNAGKQTAWSFVLLIALACSCWYFASTPNTNRLDAKTLATTIDTTIQNLKVRQYDLKGNLINTLETPLLRHIPFNDTHYLKMPHIVARQTMDAPWEIDSESATALHGGEKIIFSQNVTIHQVNHGEHQPDSVLKTEELVYFPKEKRATTEKEVVYEQAGSKILSVGMNAYLSEKRVQLLKNARGFYDPMHG